MRRSSTVIAPANPVVLVRGGHEYILNSAALAHWNITKATTSPAGGEIGRDTDGELNGELVDNARSLVKLPAMRAPTIENVLTTQRTLNAFGITSIRVPGNFRVGEFFQVLDLVLEARKRGLLTVRYNVYLPAARAGTRVTDVQPMREILARSPLKQDEGDEWVRLGGVKLGVDGGFEGGFMTKPFVGAMGRGGTYYGINTVPKGPYTAIVKMLNEGGWRVTSHAVGDAALDIVLDGYEAANAERSIAGRRWSIEHLFVSRPDQLARLKKLDVALSVQNHLYLAAPSLKKYLGMDRASQITPVKTYLEQGFLVVGGTDSPVVPVNPFWAVLSLSDPRHDHGRRLWRERAGDVASRSVADDHHQPRQAHRRGQDQGVNRNRQACRLRRALRRYPHGGGADHSADEGARNLCRRQGGLSRPLVSVTGRDA